MPRVCLLIAICGILLAAQGVRAQPGERISGPSLPIAGPAPPDEGLPPLPDEVRQKAALQMMLVVVIALALIVLLLHVFGKRMKAAPPPATPEQELVQRVDEVLRERDSGGAGEGPGPR